MRWVGTAWCEVQLPPQHEAFFLARPPSAWGYFSSILMQMWLWFPSFLLFPAIEERLPLRPKLGPRLERAPDGPLRPRDL